MTPPSMGSISDARTLLLPTTKLLPSSLDIGAHGENGNMLLLSGAAFLTSLIVSVSDLKHISQEALMIQP